MATLRKAMFLRSNKEQTKIGDMVVVYVDEVAHVWLAKDARSTQQKKSCEPFVCHSW